MGSFNLEYPGFSWVGEPINSINKSEGRVTRSGRTSSSSKSNVYYRACVVDGLYIEVDHYVVVTGEVKKDKTAKFVAKVNSLYEIDQSKGINEDENDSPYRADVEWYSFAKDLPKNIRCGLQKEYPKLHPKIEVVCDSRNFKNDIDLLCVSSSCKLNIIDSNLDPGDYTDTCGNNEFINRFKIELDGRKVIYKPVYCPLVLSTAKSLACETGMITPKKVNRNDKGIFDDSISSDKALKISLKKIDEEQFLVPTPNKTREIKMVREYWKVDSNLSIEKSSPKTVTTKRVLRDSEIVDVLDMDIEGDSESSLDEYEKAETRKFTKSKACRKKLSSIFSPVKIDSLRSIFDTDSDSDSAVITPPVLRGSRKPSLSGRKSTIRKSLLKSPSKTADIKTAARTRRSASFSTQSPHQSVITPKKSIKTLNSQTDDTPSKYIERLHIKTPKSSRKGVRSSKKSISTPSLCVSETGSPCTPLELSRQKLHVSHAPQSLTCRENEYFQIYSFVESQLSANKGGCMYISGVPGTGKTLTVTEVLKSLKKDSALRKKKFKCIELNSMRLTSPHQFYSQLWFEMTGKKVGCHRAVDLLDGRFGGRKRNAPIVLMVDELDLLWTRKQDVLYNLFDWPTRQHSDLIVLAIANTMDLPERILAARVTSRLGLTRLPFEPYNHQQLQTIIMARLGELDVFDSDGLQLIARKVAALSGDARRALEICKRATEVADLRSANGYVQMVHVEKALQEILSQPKIQAIQTSSLLEQMILQSIVAQVQKFGREQTDLKTMYSHLQVVCQYEGYPIPTLGQTLLACQSMSCSRLILADCCRWDINMKLQLNMPCDDVVFAMKHSK